MSRIQEFGNLSPTPELVPLTTNPNRESLLNRLKLLGASSLALLTACTTPTVPTVTITDQLNVPTAPFTQPLESKSKADPKLEQARIFSEQDVKKKLQQLINPDRIDKQHGIQTDTYSAFYYNHELYGAVIGVGTNVLLDPENKIGLFVGEDLDANTNEVKAMHVIIKDTSFNNNSLREQINHLLQGKQLSDIQTQLKGKELLGLHQKLANYYLSEQIANMPLSLEHMSGDTSEHQGYDYYAKGQLPDGNTVHINIDEQGIKLTLIASPYKHATE